jgi:hypothetical protein
MNPNCTFLARLHYLRRMSNCPKEAHQDWYLHPKMPQQLGSCNGLDGSRFSNEKHSLQITGIWHPIRLGYLVFCLSQYQVPVLLLSMVSNL